MTDQNFDGCEADHRYDPRLTARIISAIDDYSRENGFTPSPAPLRDTVLAVAALLHLDAARVDRLESPIDPDAFAEAAREQLLAVIQARAHKPAGARQ